jgi:hypothetical protein
MKLYHFTDVYNLQNCGPGNIMTSGLKPGNGSGRQLLPFPGCEVSGFAFPDVVWFTSEPDPGPIFVINETGGRLLKEIRRSGETRRIRHSRFEDSSARLLKPASTWDQRILTVSGKCRHIARA